MSRVRESGVATDSCCWQPTVAVSTGSDTLSIPGRKNWSRIAVQFCQSLARQLQLGGSRPMRTRYELIDAIYICRDAALLRSQQGRT